MHWQDILTILVPLLALMGWCYNRIEKKADERFNKSEERFKMIMDELKSTRKDLQSIDMRLSRLEAKFEERGYWESRLARKTGTEDKP